MSDFRKGIIIFLCMFFVFASLIIGIVIRTQMLYNKEIILEQLRLEQMRLQNQPILPREKEE